MGFGTFDCRIAHADLVHQQENVMARNSPILLCACLHAILWAQGPATAKVGDRVRIVWVNSPKGSEGGFFVTAFEVLKKSAPGKEADKKQESAASGPPFLRGDPPFTKVGGLPFKKVGPPGFGPRKGGPKVGDPAPDFELKLLASKELFKLSDNFGKRPTVLIFHSFT
jgi:hypothetical protein